MNAGQDAEILNIEDAAALFGVSQRTFKKVLRAEELPARKIGREWKFSRAALLEWIAQGRSTDYIREDTSNSESSHDDDVDRTRTNTDDPS